MIKKVKFSLIFGLIINLLLIMVSSCSQLTQDSLDQIQLEKDKKVVAMAIEELKIPDIVKADVNKIDIPKVLADDMFAGVKIEWISSNDNVINAQGDVTHVVRAGNQEIILTATVIKDNAKATKEFVIRVENPTKTPKEIEQEKKDRAYINENLGNLNIPTVIKEIETKFSVPSYLDGKIRISWKCSDSTVIKQEELNPASGQVIHSAFVREQPIVITVTATYNNVQVTKEYNITVINSAKQFTIPKAGISKAGNNIVGTFIGTNFNNSKYNLSCENTSIIEGAKIEVIDDNLIKVTLKIPNTAGKYNVIISNGSDKHEALFEVNDYTDYKIGKFILSDGRQVPYSELVNNPDNKEKAIALIATYTQYGAPLGIGVYRFLEKYEGFMDQQFSKEAIDFNSIVCTPYIVGATSLDESFKGKQITFEGDIDGSDNWLEINRHDVEGSKDIVNNYPLFDALLRYGYLQPVGYKTDWYIPSIKELVDISSNVEKLNESLKNAGFWTIGNGYYLSSSQVKGNVDKVWSINLLDKDFYQEPKTSQDGYGMAVKVF